MNSFGETWTFNNWRIYHLRTIILSYINLFFFLLRYKFYRFVPQQGKDKYIINHKHRTKIIFHGNWYQFYFSKWIISSKQFSFHLQCHWIRTYDLLIERDAAESRQTEYFERIFKVRKKKGGKPCRTETRREKGRNDVGAHRRSVFRDSVNTFRFTQTRFYSVIGVDSSPACISIGILEEQQFRNIRAARFFWMGTVRIKVARFLCRLQSCYIRH